MSELRDRVYDIVEDIWLGHQAVDTATDAIMREVDADRAALVGALEASVAAMEHLNQDFACMFVASGGHKETNEALVIARAALAAVKEEK